MQRTRNVLGLTVMAGALGVLCSGQAAAGEWAFVGARYQGMGGAGVATVNDSFASYWNPAALATAESYDAAINFDAMASVEGNALRTIDNIEEQFSTTNIDAIINTISTTGNAGGQQAVVDQLLGELARLEKDGLGVIGVASSGLSLRWKRYAVFSRAVSEFAIDPTYDALNVAIDLEANPLSIVNNTSGARVRGLAVIESGLGSGQNFALPIVGDVSVGANLKYLRGITYAKYVGFRTINNAKLNFKDSNLRKESDNFGLDLGIMVKPFDFLRVGMVARNVNSPKFKTGRDPGDPNRRKNFTLDAQVRGGLAVYPFLNDFLVIASDFDFTENESDLLDGYKSQLWSFGAEVNVPIPIVSLAVRGGGYVNTASGSNHSFVFTGGLGLRVWLLSLEVAGGVSPSKTQIEAGGDEFPNRANVSAVLAIRGSF